MEPTPQSIMSIDKDMHEARRTANQIMSMLRRFIPDACREEAYYTVLETCHKHGVELTNKLMRKEYEQWKDLILDMFAPRSPSSKAP